MKHRDPDQIAARIAARAERHAASAIRKRTLHAQRLKEAHVGIIHPFVSRHPASASAATVAALQAEIPDDDRSLTARTFGDPMRGRSALDRERGG